MTVLAVNSIVLSSIMATEEPKGERRDIGDQSAAATGVMRVTRQTRKRDLSFKSIPLIDGDSLAWEMLLSGEGECWSFSTSLFGSKGTGPTSSTGATIGVISLPPTTNPGYLALAATTGAISYGSAFLNSFGAKTLPAQTFTWVGWQGTGGVYSHYVVRRNGASGTINKWVNGVRNDAASTTWLTMPGGSGFTLTNTTGAEMQFSDVVGLPFAVLDAWPPLLFTQLPYPPTPYLDLSGDQVPEQTARRVLGEVTDGLVKTASGVRHRLNVKLVAK